MLAAAAIVSPTFALPEHAAIIGGEQADPGEYPYDVNYDFCGGALIVPEIVLTAAHCPEQEQLDITGFFVVWVGAYRKLSTDEGAQRRTVEDWVYHYKY